MLYYIKTKVAKKLEKVNKYAKIVFGRKGIIYIETKGGKYLIQNKMVKSKEIYLITTLKTFTVKFTNTIIFNCF